MSRKQRVRRQILLRDEPTGQIAIRLEPREIDALVEALGGRTDVQRPEDQECVSFRRDSPRKFTVGFFGSSGGGGSLSFGRKLL